MVFLWCSYGFPMVFLWQKKKLNDETLPIQALGCSIVLLMVQPLVFHHQKKNVRFTLW